MQKAAKELTVPLGRPDWLVFAPATFLLLWSTGYVAAKFGLAFAEPITFLALRFMCVAAIMAVLFVILRPPLPETPLDWLHISVVGFLIQALYFGMCYMAFEAGLAVGTLALILSLQPIVVGLVAPRWVSERITWRQWVGLLLGLAGAGVVIVARSTIEVPTALGLACGVLALFGISSGSLWEKRFGVSHHPVTANLIGCSVSFIVVAPLMIALEGMQIEWNWQILVSLTYLVVAMSVIGVGLLLAMIRAGDVSRVSALFFLVPPLAAVIAWVVLGEIMPPLAWVGMVIAAAGVFLATRTSNKPAQSTKRLDA